MAVFSKPRLDRSNVTDPPETSLPPLLPASSAPSPLWTYVTLVVVVTASAITLLEVARQVLFPRMRVWPSHAISIIVGSLAAAWGVYFVLRKQRAAEKRANDETLARYRAEQSLNEVSRQLAEKFRQEEEIREAHQLLQAAIDALAAHIAILDESGNIIAVNQTWRRFADENGFAGNNYGIGTNYLDTNRSGDQESSAATQGIADVLHGNAECFRLVYPCTWRNGQRWFQLRVTRFVEKGSQRLLVSQEDVTEVKLAQEAQRDLDKRILQSREEERRKIARELHDSTVQRIFAVNLNLMGLKTLLAGSEKKVQDLLAETISLGRECLQELRTISYLLRPPLPAGHDFLPALYSYIDGFCKRSGIRVNLVLPSQAGRMPPNVENALFRVVQETLNNIHRHSQSATATIALRKTEESVVLEVKDKGKGMPEMNGDGPGWATGGGLTGIQERVQELGGSLEIKPAHPGTVVIATIPLTVGLGRSAIA